MQASKAFIDAKDEFTADVFDDQDEIVDWNAAGHVSRVKNQGNKLLLFFTVCHFNFIMDY